MYPDTMSFPPAALPSFADMHALCNALRTAVRDTLARAANSNDAFVVQCSIDIAPCNLFEWLEAQPDSCKLYWSDGATAVACAGTADMLTGDTDGDVRDALSAIAERTHNSAARYYGGTRFSYISAPDALWQPYRGCMFVLPRVHIVATNRSTRLVLSATNREDIESVLLDAVERIAAPAVLPVGAPTPVQRTNTPDREHWERNIAAALHSFASGQSEKIVLARRASLRLHNSMSAWALISMLQQAAAKAFVFCFQPIEGTAFLGATPERLYLRCDQTITTGVVAGTRPRGATESEDILRRSELLSSAKDLHEHALVRQQITSVLAQFGTVHVASDSPQLIELPRLFHLFTPVESTFDSTRYSDADVLLALHPTPAVGGTPRSTALEAIAALEGFDRGWYAGPFGWASNSAAEFAVAIRSGLATHNHLHLFSGAGIVPGSDAQAEWEEIELKLGNFLTLMGTTP